MTKRSVTKDFYRLQKNIFSFSNGEARVVEFDDELRSFQVELNINDGLYKDGIFVFEVRVTDGYPIEPPEVEFKSQIFHPNIGDGFENGLVCLNLLDEIWQETSDLEDVVQGMLFLVKNPAVDDALNPYFCGFDDLEGYMTECFPNLVRNSLEGGNVEGIEFDRNPGLVQKDKLLENLELNSEEKAQIEKEFETDEGNTTSDNLGRNSAPALCDNFYFLKWETVINIPSKEEFYQRGLHWVNKNFTNSARKGQVVKGKGDYLKWLLNLAALMFGDVKMGKENVNVFPRNFRNIREFHFSKRTLTWSKQ